MTLKSIAFAMALALALALPACPAHAQGSGGVKIRVAGVSLGSGVPAPAHAPLDSYADHVADGDFHVPGILPGNPTAASLWPRVVQVACARDAASGELLCGGYDIAPMRGEYIYVRPIMVAPVPEPAPGQRAPRPPHKKPLG